MMALLRVMPKIVPITANTPLSLTVWVGGKTTSGNAKDLRAKMATGHAFLPAASPNTLDHCVKHNYVVCLHNLSKVYTHRRYRDKA